MNENHVILLTPPGAAAIAVVRLSGPKVSSFLQTHFSAKSAEHRCVHGSLSDGNRVIDDPVVVLSNEGYVADINLHGGEWVVRECLELAARNGFAISESADDFLDAQSTLDREMLIALPTARTENALRLLLEQPNRWARFKNEIEQIDKPALQERVRTILDDRSLWWMLNPPRIAIIGAPNVGKSTLANQLFGLERSITADIPGTTRDWVADWANIDGLPVHLLDTPGQRNSSDPIEQAAIERSQQEIDQADLKLLVVDFTQSNTEQRTMLDRYRNAMIVINKSDLPVAPSPGTPREGWGEGSALITKAIPVSALTGTGLDDLRQRIKQNFGIRAAESPSWWTQRQQEILTRTLDEPTALREL